MKIKLITAAGILFLFLVIGCNQREAGGKKSTTANLDHLKFTVEKADEWSNLFLRNSGWFGGDGIFAVTRDGKETHEAFKNSETFIWFSDTMIGEIENDSLQPGWSMINNSIAVLNRGVSDSNSITFKWDHTINNKPVAVFIPQTKATQKGDYYWLGDGFVNHQKNNDLYIFGYRVHNTEPGAVFGFKEVGNTLIVIPKDGQPPFANKRQMDIPFFLGKDVDSTGSFGAGVLVNTKEAGVPQPDGFVYIYGVRGSKKNVMVARVLPEKIEAFDQWTFWNGTGWSNDPSTIKTITDRASNELSVTPLEDGRYAMIFQTDGLGNDVGLRLGATPYGPFGPVIKVYDVSNDLEKDKDIFAYNAKAHPVLSKPGELLISFNVNSFDFFNDILVYPHLYRPHFIRMKYEL
ncbi:MAG: DUF4185 domain-containing protein [Ginsengibacter sp.]